MFCIKCGEPTVPDARFCAKCGASIAVPAQESAGPAASPGIQAPPAPAQVRPWVRYWARMFDVYAFSLVGGVILGIVAPRFLATKNEYVVGMMLVFAWIFVEALLLSTFQTTPGKWLFKTKIALNSGARIGFSQALSRSFKVWWRGFGTGFPIAAMITMIVAHGRLTRNGITSWDRDEGVSVTHETIGVPRVLVAIAFFIVFLFVVALGKGA